jgi:hypothetical protein
MAQQPTEKPKSFGAPDLDAVNRGKTVILDDSQYTRPSARGKRRAAKAQARRLAKKRSD